MYKFHVRQEYIVLGVSSQTEMQRHLDQEILRISLFIYYKNLYFAQDFSWKMSNNFILAWRS